MNQPDRIPIGRSVVYAVRGMPDVPNQYGPGYLVPTEITLTYRSTEDSQLGRVHAFVKGHWRREDGVREVDAALPGQHYYGDTAKWPEWLAEEARLHDPEPAAQSPVDRALLLRAADHLTRSADQLWPGGDSVMHADAAALRRLAGERPAQDEAPTLAQLAEADAGYRGLLVRRGEEMTAGRRAAQDEAPGCVRCGHEERAHSVGGCRDCPRGQQAVHLYAAPPSV